MIDGVARVSVLDFIVVIFHMFGVLLVVIFHTIAVLRVYIGRTHCTSSNKIYLFLCRWGSGRCLDGEWNLQLSLFDGRW